MRVICSPYIHDGVPVRTPPARVPQRRSCAMDSIMSFLDCNSSLFLLSDASSSFSYRYFLFNSLWIMKYNRMASRETDMARKEIRRYDCSLSDTNRLYLSEILRLLSNSSVRIRLFSFWLRIVFLVYRLSIWLVNIICCACLSFETSRFKE